MFISKAFILIVLFYHICSAQQQFSDSEDDTIENGARGFFFDKLREVKDSILEKLPFNVPDGPISKLKDTILDKLPFGKKVSPSNSSDLSPDSSGEPIESERRKLRRLSNSTTRILTDSTVRKLEELTNSLNKQFSSDRPPIAVRSRPRITNEPSPKKSSRGSLRNFEFRSIAPSLQKSLITILRSLQTPESFKEAVDDVLEQLPDNISKPIESFLLFLKVAVPPGHTQEEMFIKVENSLIQWAGNHSEILKTILELVLPKIEPYVLILIPERKRKLKFLPNLLKQ